MKSSAAYSFVVQGNINKHTANTVKTIRNHWANAEVIIATNQLTDKTVNIGQDATVCVDDPGDFASGLNKNLLRQCTTSYAGCLASSNNTIIKLRNDLQFLNQNVENWYNSLSEAPYNKSHAFLKNRVLINNFYTIDPSSSYSLTYHTSDWLLMGDKQDLLKYYQNCCEQLPQVAVAYRGNFRPEQWLNKCNLSEKFWKSDHATDNNLEAVENTYRMFESNFIMESINNLGFYSSKYPVCNQFEIAELMNSKKWYKECSSHIQI
jgi:hypothetical protein